MEKTGSINKNIAEYALLMGKGRKIIMTEGSEVQGRILLATGLSGVIQAFKDAEASKDPKITVQAEQVLLKQELQLCDKSDKFAISSLKNAITSFNDASRALTAVESEIEYRGADKTYSSVEGKNRSNGVPVDVFHNACKGHKTRLQNSLRSTSVTQAEKELIKQRISNMDTAKALYIEKQKEALGLPLDAKIKSTEKER